MTVDEFPNIEAISHKKIAANFPLKFFRNKCEHGVKRREKVSIPTLMTMVTCFS